MNYNGGMKMKREESRARSGISKHGALMLLCWLVYTCSVIGKINYAANIIQVEQFFGVTHAQAGIVSTFYFFAYGGAQIFNGVFCKKYNLKYVIFGSLIISGAINLTVGLITNFAVIKYLWLVNGFSLSVLWPCLVRLLSETLPREKMSKASTVMSTTTATGTLLVYGVSALFVALGVFRFAFYLAAVILPMVGCFWLIFYNKLTKKDETEEVESAISVQSMQTNNAQPTENQKPKGLLSYVVMLALFAVATNLVKDGLNTWVPSILKENYGLTDSLSILLTLILPMVAICGNILAQKIYKKLPDFVVVCCCVFFGSGLCLCGVIFFLHTDLFVVTLLLFACISCFTAGSNSNITSLFPLYMKGKANSGMLAGVLNGCCYIGSTISSYGLGFVADKWGWNTVFYLLLSVCGGILLIGIAYSVIRKLCLQRSEKANTDLNK